ncbi:MAG: phosphodiester glycosidase family protein [Bacteroides sp.]|nr:phosphodiester glycosidase family protein [Bacteroides sp.]
MKKNLLLISALSVALLTGCGDDNEGIPAWPWNDPVEEPEQGPEVDDFVEENTSITALGWENVKDTYGELPEGLNVYKSPATLQDRKAIAYIAVADLNKLDWDVWSVDTRKEDGSYSEATSDAYQTPSQVYDAKEKPAIVINGGFFYSVDGANYTQSLAVSNSTVLAWNINYASRDWVSIYSPTKAAFVEHADGNFEACWTYSNWNYSENYIYSEPAPNSWDNAPCDVPSATYPVEGVAFSAQTAIGGSPVLLRGGEVKNTYAEELTDIGAADASPRTAIGVTTDKKLILFVCEGRNMTEGVAGLTTEDVANVLKSLGCTEAVNLDGGGSSCMLVNGQETIKVSDGEQRSVASAVMIK